MYRYDIKNKFLLLIITKSLENHKFLFTIGNQHDSLRLIYSLK